MAKKRTKCIIDISVDVFEQFAEKVKAAGAKITDTSISADTVEKEFDGPHAHLTINAKLTDEELAAVKKAGYEVVSPDEEADEETEDDVDWEAHNKRADEIAHNKHMKYLTKHPKERNMLFKKNPQSRIEYTEYMTNRMLNPSESVDIDKAVKQLLDEDKRSPVEAVVIAGDVGNAVELADSAKKELERLGLHVCDAPSYAGQDMIGLIISKKSFASPEDAEASAMGMTREEYDEEHGSSKD